MRTPLIAGNWKMNGNNAMATELCRSITNGAANIDKIEIAVCPPFILIPTAVSALKNSPIALGAQDIDIHHDGAYTGQISATMLRDAGCHYVIVGHSERRTLYGESDQLVAAKVRTVLAGGMTPIVCVGETLQQHESNSTNEIIAKQCQAVLEDNGIDAFAHIVIAYEPIWAIGTGKIASPQHAQAIHAFIRSNLAKLNDEIAVKCRILYGGSMKSNNAAELISQPDIDGGLIGGASLTAADFLGICNAI